MLYNNVIHLSCRTEFDARGQISVITVVSQGILEMLGYACSSMLRPLLHNLVQRLKWPSAADDPAAAINSTAAVFARSDPTTRQPHLAQSLQLARYFSPHKSAVIPPVGVFMPVPEKDTKSSAASV